MSARISGVKNFESKAASLVRGLPLSQVQSQSEKGSIFCFFAGAASARGTRRLRRPPAQSGSERSSAGCGRRSGEIRRCHGRNVWPCAGLLRCWCRRCPSTNIGWRRVVPLLDLRAQALDLGSQCLQFISHFLLFDCCSRTRAGVRGNRSRALGGLSASPGRQKQDERREQ